MVFIEAYLGPVRLVWSSSRVDPGPSERRAEPRHWRAAISLPSSAWRLSWQSKPLLRIPPRNGAHPRGSGGGWCLQALDHREEEEEDDDQDKTKTSTSTNTDRPTTARILCPFLSSPSRSLRRQSFSGRAHSGMDHSRAGLDLFPTWRSAKQIGGWGHNLSPSERTENAGSRGFLGRGSTFPLLGTLPSESVGGGMTLPTRKEQRVCRHCFISRLSGPQLL